MRLTPFRSTAALLLPIAAIATAVTAASPLDATVTVPATPYRSAFAGYRPLDDVDARTWREINDTVRDVGGHGGALSPSPSGGPAPAPLGGERTVPQPEARSAKSGPSLQDPARKR